MKDIISEEHIAGATTPITSLPIWVRAPKSGTELYTGFSRAKLYELANRGEIKSVSIRHRGQFKGTRLFHLSSILKFIERVYEQQK
jgi:hypothetical protein